MQPRQVVNSADQKGQGEISQIKILYFNENRYIEKTAVNIPYRYVLIKGHIVKQGSSTMVSGQRIEVGLFTQKWYIVKKYKTKWSCVLIITAM